MVMNFRVNLKLDSWLMDMQLWTEIEDMDVRCPFVLANPWVKTNVNSREMEVI
jgi:hypothetical protein